MLSKLESFDLKQLPLDLVTVLEAILTSRQARECLYLRI